MSNMLFCFLIGVIKLVTLNMCYCNLKQIKILEMICMELYVHMATL